MKKLFAAIVVLLLGAITYNATPKDLGIAFRQTEFINLGSFPTYDVYYAEKVAALDLSRVDTTTLRLLDQITK